LRQLLAFKKVDTGSLVVLEDSDNRRIDIFERNAPSVVFIDTFAEKQDVFSPNVMEVPLGTGSGFVWDKKGHIVINYHVVRNAKFAQVSLMTPRKGEKESIGFLTSKQKQQLSPQASTSTLQSRPLR
jgi:S1-C subfamily serine protease